MRRTGSGHVLRRDPLASALLHSSPDGMLLVGDSGRIMFANQRAEELFGYERGTLLGEVVERLVPDALREVHELHRDGYGDTPYSRPMGVGLRVFGKRTDGAELPLDVSLSPLIEDSRQLVIATVRPRDDAEREHLAHDVLDTVVREVFRIGLSLQGGLRSRKRGTRKQNATGHRRPRPPRTRHPYPILRSQVGTGFLLRAPAGGSGLPTLVGDGIVGHDIRHVWHGSRRVPVLRGSDGGASSSTTREASAPRRRRRPTGLPHDRYARLTGPPLHHQRQRAAILKISRSI